MTLHASLVKLKNSNRSEGPLQRELCHKIMTRWGLLRRDDGNLALKAFAKLGRENEVLDAGNALGLVTAVSRSEKDVQTQR